MKEVYLDSQTVHRRISVFKSLSVVALVVVFCGAITTVYDTMTDAVDGASILSLRVYLSLVSIALSLGAFAYCEIMIRRLSVLLSDRPEPSSNSH